tara:strand:+ start:1794 stop:2993 length:1200 start_codon:yes stop_codon:yes gene_type:complete
MAFYGIAALGGAARKLSEGLKEERDEARELSTQKIKIFTELGLPKARARKEALRTRNKLFDSLKDAKFSIPQIAVIMREGKGQAVLDFIQNQRDLFGEAGVKPADIVALSPDYKDSGLTKDMVLKNVMGKVNTGMSVGGATKDVFGNSLTNRLGGDLGSVGQRQMNAMAEATGVSMAELQALASDDITYDPKLVQGTIRMVDPVEAARAKSALEPDRQGFTASQFLKRNLASAGKNAKIGLDIDPTDGSILYKTQSDQRDIVVEDLVNQTLADYDTSRVVTGKYTFLELRNVQNIINEQLIALNYMQTGQQQPPPPGSGTQQSAVGAAATSFTGMSANNIVSQAVKEAQGLDPADQSIILFRARKAIIADLTKNKTPQTTARQIQEEADKIVADIKSKL